MFFKKRLMLLAFVACATRCLHAASIGVPYLSPQFDGEGHLVGMAESSCTKFTLLDQPQYGGSGAYPLQSGWYVVSNEFGRIVFGDGVTVNGDVHLIVCNGQVMESDQSAGTLPGIEVQGKSSLTIYAQSPYTNVVGKVTALGGASRAGIEGASDSSITINGGWIEATGGSAAAGVGGGQNQSGENITINGGYVHAMAGQLGAGIGGGEYGDGRAITVNGGTVWASSHQTGGQMIGGGSGGAPFDIVFAGGCVSYGATPAPVDVKGNRVYPVSLPDSASKQMVCDMFSGICMIAFTNDIAYYAQDVYPLDDGHLFLYLPDGNYEVSVFDGSRTVKRYSIDVQGGPGKVECIYDYIIFESADDFSLVTANRCKNWDAILLQSVDLEHWSVWEGEMISAGRLSDSSPYRLYVRGTANTYLCQDESGRWELSSQAGGKIACLGNLESLRGGAEDSPAPAPMAPHAFGYLFSGNGALSSVPLLPATNLTVGCYAHMFENCTSLVEPAALPATHLPSGCYASMFKGCSGILLNAYRNGKLWTIPSDATGEANWNADMFADTGYFFMDDPEIGRKYYISLLTLVNPANPPRYANESDATNGVATSFVIWPNQEVRDAQPDPYAYNKYFWVTNHFDTATSEHVLDVRMTDSTTNAVLSALRASLPELVRNVTNQVPYTFVQTVPGLYYGIAGTTNLLDFVLAPQTLTNSWTLGIDCPTGTQVKGAHPAWPSEQAFYRMKATIVP